MVTDFHLQSNQIKPQPMVDHSLEKHYVWEVSPYWEEHCTLTLYTRLLKISLQVAFLTHPAGQW